MKRITLFFIFFVFNFICFSQVNLDSLWQVWEDETKEDSTRYRALYYYSWEGVLFSNPDSAVKLSYILEDFSVEKQMVKYEIYSALIRAISYSVQRKLDSASKYYKVVF